VFLSTIWQVDIQVVGKLHIIVTDNYTICSSDLGSPTQKKCKERMDVVFSKDCIVKVERTHDFRPKGPLPESVTRKFRRIRDFLVQQRENNSLLDCPYSIWKSECGTGSCN
jgi:hypothetical protein